MSAGELVIITPPSEEPITTDELRDHLNFPVGSSDKEDLLAGFITAAREAAEHIAEVSFVTRTYQLTLDAFPRSRAIALDRPPIQSVSAVQYIDADGNQQTLDPSLYDVRLSQKSPGAISLKSGESWPRTAEQPGAVTVTYVAGFGDADDVPSAAQLAIAFIAAHFFNTREPIVIQSGLMTAVEVPFSARTLLATVQNWAV